MTYTLPDLPGEWTVTTNLEEHVALYDPESKRSLALYPSVGSTASHPRWTVLGLAGYGPDCPVFGDGSPFEEAVETAIAEMEARDSGESIEIVRTVGNERGRASSECEAKAGDDDGEGEAGASEVEAPTEQVDLGEFF